jgi:hypothetical protein
MKKIIVSSTFLAALFTANAQIKLGVQAGMNVNTATVTGVSSVKNLAAPTFGIVAQIDAGPLLVRPSLNYLKSGYEASIAQALGGVGSLQTTAVKITNIEVPLDIVVPVKLSSGRLLLSASPVVTVGLRGNSESTTSINNSQVSNNVASIKFGNSTGEIKKVDYGSRFGAGFEFKNGLQINAAYKIGLSNQSNVQNNTQKNNYVSLTASWFLFK